MVTHDFIFKPGIWVGEGKVTFSASPERLRFYTKWTIEQENQKVILCKQHVEMDEGKSNVYNTFAFSNISSNAFTVELVSELFGSIPGKGLIDAKTIAWEFRGHLEFEGFEVYELQENGDYYAAC